MFMRVFHIFIPVLIASCALAQGPTPPAPVSRTIEIPIPPPPAQVPPETVVLTVGNTKITAQQFDAIADAMPEQYRAFMKGPGRKQLADQIARVLVLSAEARRRKLDETPEFQIQNQYRTDELLSFFATAAIGAETKVDDATLREYYEAHKADYERVRARHILVRMQGSPVPVRPGEEDLTDEQALARAKELRARILAGEDFAKVAKAESDDTGSASKGGELGWFGHGQMVPSFEEAAFQLETGKLGEPVKSQFGYHIIQVEEHEFQGLDQVKDGIEKKLHPELTTKALNELQKDISITYDEVFFTPPKPKK